MRLASSPSTRRYRKESRRWSPDQRRSEGWFDILAPRNDRASMLKSVKTFCNIVSFLVCIVNISRVIFADFKISRHCWVFKQFTANANIVACNLPLPFVKEAARWLICQYLISFDCSPWVKVRIQCIHLSNFDIKAVLNASHSGNSVSRSTTLNRFACLP